MIRGIVKGGLCGLSATLLVAFTMSGNLLVCVWALGLGLLAWKV